MGLCISCEDPHDHYHVRKGYGRYHDNHYQVHGHHNRGVGHNNFNRPRYFDSEYDKDPSVYPAAYQQNYVPTPPTYIIPQQPVTMTTTTPSAPRSSFIQE